MRPLRVGLAGLGTMGRHHARVLRSLEGVELVAVADPGGDRYRAADGLPVLGSVDELIAAGIDYCVVAVPTTFHEKVGLALADAGIPSLIEKPLAGSVDAAARLCNAFSERGIVGGVGHIERYNPALQAARTRIAQGELGAVYQVATRRQSPFPSHIADVGVVLDLATHDLDLTAWVTQQSFVAISARTANRSGRPYEDLVAAIGSLSGGTVTSHLVNWLSPMKERTIVITGEKGTFTADTLTADLTFYENGIEADNWDDLKQFRGIAEGNIIRYAIPKPEPLRVEHETFRDAVLGKPADTVTMEQALATVVAAQACIDSANSGKTVELPA